MLVILDTTGVNPIHPIENSLKKQKSCTISITPSIKTFNKSHKRMAIIWAHTGAMGCIVLIFKDCYHKCKRQSCLLLLKKQHPFTVQWCVAGTRLSLRWRTPEFSLGHQLQPSCGWCLPQELCWGHQRWLCGRDALVLFLLSAVGLLLLSLTLIPRRIRPVSPLCSTCSVDCASGMRLHAT